MNAIRKIVLAAAVIAAVYTVRGMALEEEESELLQCGRLLTAPEQRNDSYVERKYAPDRTVDILHVAINVTPDFKARTIRGVTSIRFAPIARAGGILAGCSRSAGLLGSREHRDCRLQCDGREDCDHVPSADPAGTGNNGRGHL